MNPPDPVDKEPLATGVPLPPELLRRITSEFTVLASNMTMAHPATTAFGNSITSNFARHPIGSSTREQVRDLQEANSASKTIEVEVTHAVPELTIKQIERFKKLLKAQQLVEFGGSNSDSNSWGAMTLENNSDHNSWGALDDNGIEGHLSMVDWDEIKQCVDDMSDDDMSEATDPQVSPHRDPSFGTPGSKEEYLRYVSHTETTRSMSMGSASHFSRSPSDFEAYNRDGSCPAECDELYMLEQELNGTQGSRRSPPSRIAFQIPPNQTGSESNWAGQDRSGPSTKKLPPRTRISKGIVLSSQTGVRTKAFIPGKPIPEESMCWEDLVWQPEHDANLSNASLSLPQIY